MLYILSLLYIILKGLAFVINNEILLHLEKTNIIFAMLIIFLIILCKRILKHKKIIPEIVDYLMQYRFKSKEDCYYSVNILFCVIFSYIFIAIYLRISSFNKPVDLTVICNSLYVLYIMMSKGVLCYNLLMLGLLIYLIFLIIYN